MKYSIVKEKHQKEINALPLGFAFSKKQFEQMMINWGLKSDDTDKIYSLGDGTYIQRKDSDLIHKVFDRHIKEHEELMKHDDEYALTAFKDELSNHEFGYTYDTTDTLDALGFTLEEINADERLLKIFKEAQKPYYTED